MTPGQLWQGADKHITLFPTEWTKQVLRYMIEEKEWTHSPSSSTQETQSASRHRSTLKTTPPSHPVLLHEEVLCSLHHPVRSVSQTVCVLHEMEVRWRAGHLQLCGRTCPTVLLTDLMSASRPCSCACFISLLWFVSASAAVSLCAGVNNTMLFRAAHTALCLRCQVFEIYSPG